MRTLLYVPPLGAGIRDLRETGQHRRLLDDYCSAYRQNFERILILSHFAESAEDYKILPGQGIEILANRWGFHRYVFAVLAPFLFWRETARVQTVRVSQATGALAALAFRLVFCLRGRKPFFAVTYGYDYVLFATVRGWWAMVMARLHEFLARRVADAWITTTPELVEHLETKLGAKPDAICLIPNGVAFSRKVEIEGSGDSEPLRRLIFVGRLEAQKNLETLIVNLGRFAQKNRSPLLLTIVGEGSLRPLLSNQASLLRDWLRVDFLGSLEHARLPEIFSGHQVFVTATRFEGHPKAVIEAMACGLPVVGPDSPGVGGLLRQSGQLVYRSVEEFEGSLLALGDPNTRNQQGRAAMNYAQKNFDLKTLLKRESHFLSTRLVPK